MFERVCRASVEECSSESIERVDRASRSKVRSIESIGVLSIEDSFYMTGNFCARTWFWRRFVVIVVDDRGRKKTLREIERDGFECVNYHL